MKPKALAQPVRLEKLARPVTQVQLEGRLVTPQAMAQLVRRESSVKQEGRM